MALWDPGRLFEFLGRHLPGDIPAACVYWGGYQDREKVVRGRVADLGPKLVKEGERFMGLVLVGRFLEKGTFESAMH